MRLLASLKNPFQKQRTQLYQAAARLEGSISSDRIPLGPISSIVPAGFEQIVKTLRLSPTQHPNSTAFKESVT